MATNKDIAQPRKPKNFLEQHALGSLNHSKTWTLTMYAVFNDLDEDCTQRLREFLRGHLPEERLV